MDTGSQQPYDGADGARGRRAHVGGDRRPALRPRLPPRPPPDRQPARRRGPHPGGLRPRLPQPLDVHRPAPSRAGSTGSPPTSSSTRPAASSGSASTRSPTSAPTGCAATCPRPTRRTPTRPSTTTSSAPCRPCRRSSARPSCSATSRVCPTTRSPRSSTPSSAPSAPASTAAAPCSAPRSPTAPRPTAAPASAAPRRCPRASDLSDGPRDRPPRPPRQRAPRRPDVRRPTRSGPGSTSTPATSAATPSSARAGSRPGSRPCSTPAPRRRRHLKGSLLFRGIAAGWDPHDDDLVGTAAAPSRRHLGMTGIGSGAVGAAVMGVLALGASPANAPGAVVRPGGESFGTSLTNAITAIVDREQPTATRGRRVPSVRTPRRWCGHWVVHSRSRAATAPSPRRPVGSGGTTVESQDGVSDEHPGSSDDTAPLSASDGAELAAAPRAAAAPPVDAAGPGARRRRLRHRVPRAALRRRPDRPTATPPARQPPGHRAGGSRAGSGRWSPCSPWSSAWSAASSAARRTRTGTPPPPRGRSAAASARPAPSPRRRCPASNHSVASVAQQLLPSTIQVLAQYQGKKDGATGSGFVLDRSGHYITNNHVVADAVDHHGPIEIIDQNGDKYAATVVGRSPTYDLAVLYVKDGPKLPPASLGSAGVLRVGDQVVAFGSPLGLSSTVTAGHRQRAEPAGDHERRRRVGQLVVHQRRADRRRDQPGQLRRPAGRPHRSRGRGQLRDRHDRQHRVDRGGQHRRRVRDPDRPGEDHRRPDPAHRAGALPGDRRQRRHRRHRRSRRQDPRRHLRQPGGQGRDAQGRPGHRGRGREGGRRDRADRGDPSAPAGRHGVASRCGAPGARCRYASRWGRRSAEVGTALLQWRDEQDVST